MRRSWWVVLLPLLAGCTESVVHGSPERVVIEPDWVDLPRGSAVRLRALALWPDGAPEDVTGEVVWTSTNPTVAAVGEGGSLSGLRRGAVRVEATLHAATGRAVVVVSESPVECAVRPAELTMERGEVRSLGVVATFEDGTAEELSREARWESTDESAVAVEAGVAEAACPGSSEVRAWLGDLACRPATVRVPDPSCASLTVMIEQTVLALDELTPVSATCPGPDGLARDVTREVAWSSSDPSVAEVERLLPPWDPALVARSPGTTEVVASVDRDCASPLSSTPVLVTVVAEEG